MKTYIIQLEAHDDVISARDKLSWNKSPRVLVVFPQKGSPLERPLDLLLLQRYAQSLGATLGIVSQSPTVIRHAKELGIPCFANPIQAQRGSWRRSRARKRLSFRWNKERPRISPNEYRLMLKEFHARPSLSGWQRIAVFLIALLSVLALLAVFVPSAQVILPLPQQEQALAFETRAVPDISLKPSAGVLPAQQVETIVEGSIEVPSSGNTPLPQTPATGEVEFTNLTDQRVVIPAGATVLSNGTPPLAFQTLGTVTLPAGIGQKRTVGIRAVLPGSSGNLPANAIVALEGSTGLLVTVNNPQPTMGGSDQPVPAPTLRDYQQAREKLIAILTETAGKEIAFQLTEGHLFVDGSLQPAEILEESREPEAGMPGDVARLTLRMRFTGLSVHQSDLSAVCQTILDLNRPENFQVVENTLSCQQNSPATRGTDGSVKFTLTARRILEPIWSPQRISREIVGQPVETAQQRIRKMLDLEKDPGIVVFPTWWNRLPFFPFRIQVSRP
ncbi:MULTISPECIES: baseplate J/gp47 family protein [Anaerolinea]|uniref:baseplate J/gp47 family protein n=1 Tax=Anaerolinea TaxID=233189 RepID=UPI00261E5BFB|nr:baseplate J/gp47 family protein [Anaerolinea thermophila]